MFQLLRLGYNDFAVITHRQEHPHCRGNTDSIISFLMTQWDIHPNDIQLAFEDLICHDNNVAEFGVMGRYIFSTKKEHFRKN